MSRLQAKIALLLLAASLLLAACGDEENSDSAVAGESTSTESSTSVAEDGAGDAPVCEDVEAPAPKKVDLPGPKAMAPTASEVVFQTSCGEFTVSLDAEDNPKTAASFQYLAEEGVFDNTQFHRIAPGFVIQGGDPAGDGTGDAGFTVDEKPPADTAYTNGVVAMAKTEVDPPGRSGSQFFVVSGADAGLPPQYAVAGEVTDGLDVVAAIDALGQPNQQPARPVVIETATAK